MSKTGCTDLEDFNDLQLRFHDEAVLLVAELRRLRLRDRLRQRHALLRSACRPLRAGRQQVLEEAGLTYQHSYLLVHVQNFVA